MKRTLLLVAFVLPSVLRAQHTVSVGGRVRLAMQEEGSLVGDLVLITHDSASVRTCDGCVPVVVARTMIRRLDVSRDRKDSENRNLLLSLLGGGAGAALTIRFGRCTEGPCAADLLAVPAAIVGSIAGTIIGQHIKSDRWEPAILP
jgi:hypothetical protein